MLELAKPVDKESEAEEDVNNSCRRFGLVVEVYCPGRRRTLVDIPDAERVAPTGYSYKYDGGGSSTLDSRVVLE